MGDSIPYGPHSPNAGARFVHKILEILGFGYAWRSKLIVAARMKPYVDRRRKAYFARRAQRLSGGSEYRPAIFPDAPLIDKNAAGYTWAPSGDADVNVLEDHNVGGTGERRAIPHALVDWGDSSGYRRASNIRDSLMIVRGLAISHNEFPHPVV